MVISPTLITSVWLNMNKTIATLTGLHKYHCYHVNLFLCVADIFYINLQHCLFEHKTKTAAQLTGLHSHHCRHETLFPTK